MKSVNLNIDFDKKVGIMKPMHGVGQPPQPASNGLYHYLTEAGIPYSRLHDVGGWMGGGLYVDIPNIFRDFDADENDPESYDFAFTDQLIRFLINAKCEPYFRLGVTIENQHMLKAYRIFPPKDNAKWARICEKVIAHYIDGWANGFNYKITYWEIWNEPDDCFKNETSAMWKGTPEQFYDLYCVTAKHLKNVFGDRIKVGGYGHCGFYEFEQDKELCGIGREPEKIYEFTIEFTHGFLRRISEENVPLDFFSWHVYDNCHHSTEDSFRIIAKHADYCRALLDRYGYTKTEQHLNEWNLWTKIYERDHPQAAAKSLAFMLMMQNTDTDIMCYYDGRVGYSSYCLFNPDNGTPYRVYYAFAAFNTLYRLKNQVLAESDDDDIFVGAAANGIDGAIAIANINDDSVVANINALGFSTNNARILFTDLYTRRTLTGRTLENGRIVLPPNSCVEIQLTDASKI